MPRKKTARKQAEKFVSKVSDEMVEDRLLELYPGKSMQVRFARSPEYKSRLLAYIRAVMELEEINREIEDIRAKQGVQASLVNIGPRGGRTLTPLQRSRRTKVNQVLRKYRSVRQSTEWLFFRGVEGKASLLSAMSREERHPRGDPSRPPRDGADKTAKKRKKAKKSSSQPATGRRPRRWGQTEFIGSTEPLPPESSSPHDSVSSGGKSQKTPPTTEQDLERAIEAVEMALLRKGLLPEKRMTFQATLPGLKDWKDLIKIARDAKLLLGLGEDLARLLEFLRSLF